MDANPTTWLVCRERSQSFLAWCVALFVVLWFMLVTWMDESSALRAFGWWIANIISVFALYLWVASHASQFFADARRGGLIE